MTAGSGAGAAVKPGTSQTIRALVANAGIEVVPLRNAAEKLHAVPAGATIIVTTSARVGLDQTLEFAERASRAGFDVVPHLAARQLTGEDELRRFVGRLGELEIGELYLIGGDAAPPAGPYGEPLHVLRALEYIDHGLSRIGVACYPEGHPKVSDAALVEALRAKQPYSAYMVSPLCFSPDVLVSWLRGVRQAGVTLPLHIGLAAPMQLRRLLAVGSQIGVGSSLRYLARQHGLIGGVLMEGVYRPESLLLRMGDALTSQELGIGRVHLFSFNQVDITVEWQCRIAGRPSAAA
jgi:methylenetetrahydrofolate reductase (NADPH)